MNENQARSSAPADENPALNDRVVRKIKIQQRISRVLTATALFFGFVAIGASIALVVAYSLLYLPKQKQLLRDYQKAAEKSLHNYAPNPGDPKSYAQMAEAHIFMTHVASAGTMLLAVSVAVLAGGTLVLLIVTILNRRLALSQINASLAQISGQIKELKNQRPS